MTWNIENRETKKLAAEVAELTGETKEGAVHEALREKKERLEMRAGGKPKRDLHEFFEKEIWPLFPSEALDQPPMTKEEEEKLLGYDEDDR
ncbi:MAG TPA: type II toxin-antitoxin system VapB family antitoxin [Solirubrobacterales bacterium]|nr:type II toxin-antitoxin system VapB family antitoxin [Solirubrobacterales bacterium]